MSEFNFGLDDLDRAAAVVYQSLAPPPQFAWPLPAAELGAKVWVKHENFTPTGAFKVRGVASYALELLRGVPDIATLYVPIGQGSGISGLIAARVLAVTDAEVAAAMCLYFSATHSTAEGAGAAPLAGAMQERARNRGRRIAVVLSGGNVNRAMFSARAGLPTPGLELLT